MEGVFWKAGVHIANFGIIWRRRPRLLHGLTLPSHLSLYPHLELLWGSPHWKDPKSVQITSGYLHIQILFHSCTTFISVVVIKYTNQKQPKGRKGLLGSQFQVTFLTRRLNSFRLADLSLVAVLRRPTNSRELVVILGKQDTGALSSYPSPLPQPHPKTQILPTIIWTSNLVHHKFKPSGETSELIETWNWETWKQRASYIILRCMLGSNCG